MNVKKAQNLHLASTGRAFPSLSAVAFLLVRKNGMRDRDNDSSGKSKRLKGGGDRKYDEENRVLSL